MDRNAIRLNLGSRISELRRERDRDGATPAEKEAANAAIDQLQDARDTLNSEADAELVAAVDKLVARLEAVRTSKNLDAVSALGVAIGKVKALTQQA